VTIPEVDVQQRSIPVAKDYSGKRQTNQKSVTVVESAENEGGDLLPHNLDSDVTFQLPEPA